MEPDNKVDKNAVLIVHEEHVLGYVGRSNIPRVHKAIIQKEITGARMMYVYQTWAPDGKKYLWGKIALTKRGKWSSEVTNYVYNQLL